MGSDEGANTTGMVEDQQRMAPVIGTKRGTSPNENEDYDRV